jgi:hypothetical protein
MSAALPELSTELEREDAQPYFLWDMAVTVGELRKQLRHPDVAVRALWMARVMREARYPDVWKFLSLDDVLAHLPLIRRHLGRARAFWDFLLEGWHSDGLLPRPPQ